MLRMLALTMSAWLAGGLSGCTRCSSPAEFESFVAEPTTLEGVKALHDPPDVTVEVTKGQKESSGGGACGHSPACIILLPIIVGELAFPAHFRNATVTEGGNITYQAVFRENGEFVRASARKGNVQREIQMLQLRVLKRNLVVEVGTSSIGADGKPGPLTPTSIQKQVDLVAAYSEILQNESHKQRAAALLEAMTTLGTDAEPLVKTHIGSEQEDPDFKAAVLEGYCRTSHSYQHPTETQQLMETLLASKPPPAPLLKALGCYSLLESHSNHARPQIATTPDLLKRTLSEVCIADNTELVAQLDQLVAWAGVTRQSKNKDDHLRRLALSHEVETCQDGPARTLLRFLTGFELSTEELTSIATDPRFRTRVIAGLDTNLEADHQICLKLLQDQEALENGPLLRKLNQRRARPEAEEVKLLTARVQQVQNSYAELAIIIHRLTRTSAELREEALRTLEKQLHTTSAAQAPKAKQADNPAPSSPPPSSDQLKLHAALAALGKHESELPLARSLLEYRDCSPPKVEPTAEPSATGNAPPPSASPAPTKPAQCLVRAPRVTGPGFVYQDKHLAAYALHLAGCQLPLDPMLERLSETPRILGALCVNSNPNNQ